MMQVTICNEEIIFEGEIHSIDELNKKVDEICLHQGLIISALKIDGVEVDIGIEEYVRINRQGINKIVIELISRSQLVQHMVFEGERYLFRALPEIKKLAEDFYKGVNTTTWEKIEQLMEAMQWLLHLAMNIKACSESFIDEKFVNDINLVAQSLTDNVGQLGESIQNEDFVLTGDYLLYEIYPELEKYYQVLQSSLNFEVNTDALN